jgi:hypothetical protein
MTDHRPKDKRVLRRERRKKKVPYLIRHARRPSIPAPKIESGIRPESRLYDELETVYDEADRTLLDIEFDK